MPQVSRVYPLPTPTGGWNDKDSIVSKPVNDASILINWFPTTSNIESRKGFSEHADTGEDSQPVEALHEIVAEGGTAKLLAACNNKLFDVTTSTVSDVTNSATITTDKWQVLTMNHTSFWFNGTDQCLKSTGGNFTANAFTGVADDATLIQATNYRDRLYVIEKDKASFWYHPTAKATAGALLEYDLSAVIRKGGDLEFLATLSMDDGGGLDDRLVIMTTEGEALIYEGSWPGGSDWRKVGQYFLPRPLGRRAFVNLDNDLLLITEQGVISLVKTALSQGESSYILVSDKIQNAFRQVGSDYFSNFGWCAVTYPDGPYLLVNVPTSVNERSEQYVMNLLTGAWCKFTGQSANCWVLFQGNLYFGGNNGKVYKANTGNKDDQSSIPVDLQTAFNYLNTPGNEKHVNMVRPFFRTDGDATFTYRVDVDFQTVTPSDTFSLSLTEGSEWDEDAWDVASWAGAELIIDWQGATAIGVAAALRLKADLDGTRVALNAIQLNYVTGGIL